MNDDSTYIADEQEQVSSGFLNAIPAIVWQRRWLIIIPFIFVSVAAVMAAFLLPRSYRSSAILLVESQDLPSDVSNGPGDNIIDRRIAKIKQQILSRPDLISLIQTNNLYNAARRDKPLSELVEKMRDATNISAVDADIGGGAKGRNAGSIAFSLTFDYPQAEQAQLVAQTFVDRLLKLDASETQAEAATNVHFLEDQESGLQTQVSALESQINRITGQNGAALASTGSLGMMSLSSGGDYDGQVAQLQRQNAELSAQSGASAVGRDPNVLAAQAQLAAARAQYSDDHPDVKLAESRLAAAKSTAAAFQANSVASVVQRQISANNAAIARLNQARNVEQSRAATMAAAQARGPMVAQQVAQLQARADGLRANLSKVSTNLMNARSMSKIADEQRGERLMLVDPPVTPDQPSQPNRLLIIFGGVFAGLALGGVLALLVEFVHRPIRSVSALTKVVGAPPLAVVPVLSKRTRRRSFFRKKARTA